MKTQKLTPDKKKIYNKITTSANNAIIVAGPGTGKTFLMAAIASKLYENNLLFLSTTNAARDAFLKNCKKFNIDLDDQVKTYHSFSTLVLNKCKGLEIKTPPPYLINECTIANKITFLDDKDDLALFTQEAYKNNIDLPKAKYFREKKYSTKCLHNQSFEKYPEMIKTIRNYQSIKLKKGYYHYHDLIMLASSTLIQHPDVTTSITNNFPLIIADEFQDLNKHQLNILIALAKSNGRILATGDPRQIINDFAGAYNDIFNDYIKALGPEVYHLKTCRRLTQTSVEVANTFLKEYQSGFPLLTIDANAEIGERPILIRSFTNSDMSECACHYIQVLQEQRVPLNEIAVLYKVRKGNLALALLVNKLEEKKIKYVYCPNKPVSPIFNNLINLLKLINDPTNRYYIKNNLMIIKGVGTKTASKLSKIISKKGLCLISTKYSDKINHLFETCRKCSSLSFKEQINEALILMGQFISNKKLQEQKFVAFTKWLQVNDSDNLLSSNWESDFNDSYKKEEVAITLSTIHSAKGKEFSYVIFLDASGTVFNNICPSPIEANIFFVGITRHKK